MNKSEFPSQEQNEKPLEQQVIDALRDKGKEDPDALALLNKWLDIEEQSVTEQNTTAASLDLNIRRARLYREAGLHFEALEAFEDAYQMAYYEDNEAICTELNSEIEALELPETSHE